MTRSFTMIVAAAFVTCALQAQNPMSTEVKNSYTRVKNNILKAADKMSEDNYAFKATSDVRPFSALLAHTADANMRTCSAIKGETKSVGAASKTTKADIVAALKESFAYCDTVYDSLTDTDAASMVKMGRGESSKIAGLYGIVGHDNEMYGTMCVYMRLKGVVPPSSEGR